MLWRGVQQKNILLFYIFLVQCHCCHCKLSWCFNKVWEGHVQIIYPVSTRGGQYINSWLTSVPRQFSNIPRPPQLIIICSHPSQGWGREYSGFGPHYEFEPLPSDSTATLFDYVRVNSWIISITICLKECIEKFTVSKCFFTAALELNKLHLFV